MCNHGVVQELFNLVSYVDPRLRNKEDVLREGVGVVWVINKLIIHRVCILNYVNNSATQIYHGQLTHRTHPQKTCSAHSLTLTVKCEFNLHARKKNTHWNENHANRGRLYCHSHTWWWLSSWCLWSSCPTCASRYRLYIPNYIPHRMTTMAAESLGHKCPETIIIITMPVHI